MSNRCLCTTLVVGCLGAILALAPASAQVCGPDENGRLAEVSYGSTTIQWDPVVEYREMVLTIGGPCEDIVKVFGPKETIFFDLREIERVTDGQYTWQLRRVAKVDEGVQKELEASRGSGKEDQVWWSFWQKGAIPAGPFVDSASFAVVEGEIIGPDGRVEEKSASLASRGSGGGASAAIQSALPGALAGTAASEQSGNVLAPKATVLTNADGVIRNSLCVGFDCPNNPTFSDTTILMMENNTRIKFDDTSTITGFPRNDWEIEANSSVSGGASYLGFNDCGNSSQGGCATDLVFAVEAGVRQNALYVESDGDVGIGTANPVLRLHVTKGDSPGLRLEQDGSSGFAPQTWDVVGNETNFFVRDATGGSTLPFRIRPGAPSNSIHIAAGGNVGMGTSSPDAALDIQRAGGGAAVSMLRFTNTNGPSRLEFRDDTGSVNWDFRTTSGDTFVITQPTSPTNDFLIASNGNVTVRGTLTTSGPTCGSGCDRVFAPDFELESIEEHAALMWANSYLPAVGPTRPGEAFNVSEKTGGILNELEKAHIYIEQLNAKLTERDALIQQLARRLDQLETTAPLEAPSSVD